MTDPRGLAAQDLLVAVFRLAAIDINDVQLRDLRTIPVSDPVAKHGREAARFVASDWAAELADMAGIPIAEIRRKVVQAGEGGTPVARQRFAERLLPAHATVARPEAPLRSAKWFDSWSGAWGSPWRTGQA